VGRHPLDDVEEVARHERGLAGGDLRGAGQQLDEQRLELEAGELIAQAVVDAPVAQRTNSSMAPGIPAAVGYTLTKAADDPLFKAFLVTENSETFLPLLTSDGEPVVAADDLALAGETITRLTLSHIVLPLYPADIVADQIARTGCAVARPR
jgi:hypothetical protein